MINFLRFIQLPLGFAWGWEVAELGKAYKISLAGQLGLCLFGAIALVLAFKGLTHYVIQTRR